MRYLFRVKKKTVRLQLASRDEMCNFEQFFFIFGAKSQFFVLESRFCQQGISLVCRGLQLSHPDNSGKISVSMLWVIFGGSPLFLAISGLCHFAIVSTLTFGPSSMKLGGTVRAIKKMTHNENRPGPELWRNGLFLRSAKKCFFWPKMHFSQKNTQILLIENDIYFGKRVVFSLKNFFWSWPEHGVPKIRFLPYDPTLVNSLL